MVVELRQKAQVTIPAEILKALNLKPGDKLEFSIQDGKIVIQPVVTIPKEQAWFWAEQWQADEKAVDAEIKSGQLKHFDNVDDFLAGLDK